jgi:hypothetical protein
MTVYCPEIITLRSTNHAGCSVSRLRVIPHFAYVRDPGLLKFLGPGCYRLR